MNTESTLFHLQVKLRPSLFGSLGRNDFPFLFLCTSFPFQDGFSSPFGLISAEHPATAV